MKTNVIIVSILILLFTGCIEKEYQPLVKNGNKPGTVKVLEIENFAGGAKISYTLPDDADILYVLASFKSPQNENRQVKSSVYSNFVLIDGFAEEKDISVELVAVNKSENKSDPVIVSIAPLRASLHDVFESLTVGATFGGVNTHFLNPLGGEYILHTLYQNPEGEWVTYDRLYTKSTEREYAVRGLPPEKLEFRFFFTDKWKNHSDTLQIALTPLFEVKLDKNLWKSFPLPTDTYEPLYGDWSIEGLWDGTTARIFYVNDNLPGLKLPNWFTINIGKESQLSRIRVNQMSHNDAWIFSSGAPRIFEIYGSNKPGSDGSWDSWTLLGEFESVKPSDRPLGVLSAEDIALGKEGEDFTFPLTIPSVKYIRFKTKKTWGGNENVMLGELTLWGQPIE